MRAGVALALLGVLSPVNGDHPTLTRLDPASLKATGPRLRLGEYRDNWSFSPDGRQVALGKGGAGETCGRGVCIVDLDSLTIAGQIDAPIAVEAVAWLRPRRIVAVLQSGGILVADPVTGAIVRRVPLPFTAYAAPVGADARRARGGHGRPAVAVGRRRRARGCAHCPAARHRPPSGPRH